MTRHKFPATNEASHNTGGAVLRALVAVQAPLTAAELAVLTERTRDPVHRALRELREAGRVEGAHGLYWLVEDE